MFFCEAEREEQRLLVELPRGDDESVDVSDGAAYLVDFAQSRRGLLLYDLARLCCALLFEHTPLASDAELAELARATAVVDARVSPDPSGPRDTQVNYNEKRTCTQLQLYSPRTGCTQHRL